MRVAIRFNPPPGWPAPPDGWVPPTGWQPDPGWPAAPPGWQIWTDEGPLVLTGGPDELISSSDLTVAYLRAVLTEAYMNVGVDDVGDLWTRDACLVWVFPWDKLRRVRVAATFAFKPEVSEQDRLRCVNRINSEFLMVRAHTSERFLQFDYDICFDAPISRRAFVAMVRRFSMIAHEAVGELTKDMVE